MKKHFPTALIVVMTAVVIGRLWNVPILYGDDPWTAVVRYVYGGWWEASVIQAQSQGRFYQVFAYGMAQIPFLSGGLWGKNLALIVSNLLVLGALFWSVLRVLGSRRLALLATLITVALWETRYSYNPFSTHPFWFSLPMGFSLLGIGFFEDGLERGRRRSVAISTLFFALSILFYEVFLFYLPLYAFLIMRREKKVFTPVYRLLWPHCLAVGLYLVAYVLFAKLNPNNYSGTKLSWSSGQEFFNALWVLSSRGLNLWSFSRPWSFHAIDGLMAFCAGVGLFLILRLPKERDERGFGWAAIFGALYMFVPNLLFALTERYRWWVKSDPYYLATYFSSLFEAVVLALLFLLVTRFRKPFVRNAAAVVVAVVVAVGAYQNSGGSREVYDYLKARSVNWPRVDGWIGEGAPGLVEGAVILAPSLADSQATRDYWSFYISARAGKKISVVGSEEDIGKLPDGAGRPVFLTEFKEGRLTLAPRPNRIQ